MVRYKQILVLILVFITFFISCKNEHEVGLGPSFDPTTMSSMVAFAEVPVELFLVTHYLRESLYMSVKSLKGQVASVSVVGDNGVVLDNLRWDASGKISVANDKKYTYSGDKLIKKGDVSYSYSGDFSTVWEGYNISYGVEYEERKDSFLVKTLYENKTDPMTISYNKGLIKRVVGDKSDFSCEYDLALRLVRIISFSNNTEEELQLSYDYNGLLNEVRANIITDDDKVFVGKTIFSFNGDGDMSNFSFNIQNANRSDELLNEGIILNYVYDESRNWIKANCILNYFTSNINTISKEKLEATSFVKFYKELLNIPYSAIDSLKKSSTLKRLNIIRNITYR